MSRKKSRKPEPRQDHSFNSKKRSRSQQPPPPIKAELLPITPRTRGQEELIDAIHRNELTICDGPAGSGKTLISFGSALHYRVSDKNIKRIVIVRPIIPAGDDDEIGYLPGDINEKLGPFTAPLLRDSVPLLVSSQNHLSPTDYKAFIEEFLASLDIEVVPMTFLRGRTFNNSFIILDEAQNCTKADLKLFLTRIGSKSKVIIEGDSTQCDREDGYLPQIKSLLNGMKGVGVVDLGMTDIVRNPMIAELLRRLPN